MDSLICFIDDSAFEHDLVQNEIAPLADGMTFLQTVTFEEAVDRLNGRAPALFLLDLWGQDPDVSAAGNHDPCGTPGHGRADPGPSFRIQRPGDVSGRQEQRIPQTAVFHRGWVEKSL